MVMLFVAQIPLRLINLHLMNRKIFKKKLIKSLSDYINPSGFIPNKTINLDCDEFNFLKEDSVARFHFTVRILENNRLETWLGIEFHELTKQIKKATNWKPGKYYKGYLAISVKLGLLINPLNKDGYFNSNDCIDIKFPHNYNSDSLEKLESQLLIDHFKKCALKTFEKLNSIKKLDEILNNEPLSKGDLPRIFFPANIYKEIFISVLSAIISERKNLNEVVDKYLSFIENDNPYDNIIIKHIYQTLNYFRLLSN